MTPATRCVPDARTHVRIAACVCVFFVFVFQVAAAVRLLAKGADRHLRDHDGRTAMDWANRFGSTRLLDVLLFDPNNVKIFLIARERDVRGVLALMEQGVDPNTTCPERNYTPLIAAVFNQVRGFSRVF